MGRLYCHPQAFTFFFLSPLGHSGEVLAIASPLKALSQIQKIRIDEAGSMESLHEKNVTGQMSSSLISVGEETDEDNGEHQKGRAKKARLFPRSKEPQGHPIDLKKDCESDDEVQGSEQMNKISRRHNWHERSNIHEKEDIRPLFARHELLANIPTRRATHKSHSDISAALIEAGGQHLMIQTPTTAAPVGSTTPAGTTTPAAGAATTAAPVAASPPVEEESSSWTLWIFVFLLIGLIAGGAVYVWRQSQKNSGSMDHMPSRLGNVQIGGAGADQEEIARKTESKSISKSVIASQGQSDSDSDDDRKKKNQKAAASAGDDDDKKKSGGESDLKAPSTRSRYKRGP